MSSKQIYAATLEGVAGDDLPAAILAAPSARRRDLIEAYLCGHVARLLDIESNQVPVERPFLELGLDSLMLMDIIGAVTKDLQLTLYPRELFDRPTIASLADYLAVEIDHMRGVATPAPASAPESSRARLENWTSQEAKGVPGPTKRLSGVAFLLSTPRAGSTLLRVMLAGHERLFCPPELHLLPFASVRERADKLERTDLAEGLLRALMELKHVDAEGAKAIVAELSEKRASIQEVFELLLGLAGDRLLVDKSPSYASSTETLERAEALFEGAKYVFLVRHPYAVIESVVRNRMDKLIGVGSVDSATFAEELWATQNGNVIDFLENVEAERKHQVRYEDLVADPEGIMRGVCEFLGVPFDPHVLTPYEGNRMTDGIHAQSRGQGDPNFLKHRAIERSLGEVWREPRFWRKLGGFAKRIALELGYELPGQA